MTCRKKLESTLALNQYLALLEDPQVGFRVRQNQSKNVDKAVRITLEMESYMQASQAIHLCELPKYIPRSHLPLPLLLVGSTKIHYSRFCSECRSLKLDLRLCNSHWQQSTHKNKNTTSSRAIFNHYILTANSHVCLKC